MKKLLPLGLVSLGYTLFIILARAHNIKAGTLALKSLIQFSGQMMLLLPFAFILIGLFDEWIKKETIEKFLGNKTGFSAYLYAVLLAASNIGGIYAAFPFAASLHKKGAKLGVVFTYLACAGICRIPMTLFEASLLGVKFTLIRFFVSLPLVIISSWAIGLWLESRHTALGRAWEFSEQS
jgi:uncharacterized membrane protein YraQ (UPF0718 family)